MVAQKEARFVHYDMHMGNLLVQRLSNNVNFLGYHHQGQCWYLQSDIIKITGR
jgi:predicted unusual protein kinase regulating ubiquinone biosynthesis (AarF/ABC1/UbiB family)